MVEGLEWVEELRNDVFRNSDAVVLHSNLEEAVALFIGLGADLDLSLDFRVLDGVGYQVNQDLLEPVLVAFYLWVRFKLLDFEIQLDFLAAGLQPKQVLDIVKQFLQLNGLNVKPEDALLNLRVVQNVIDQRKKQLAVADDDVQEVLGLS